LEIGEKPRIFRLSYQPQVPQPIALESCSNPQKTWQVFESAMKKNWGFGFHFFVSDIISKVGFWPFLAVGT